MVGSTSTAYSLNYQEGDTFTHTFYYDSGECEVQYLVTHAPNNNSVQAYTTNEVFPIEAKSYYINSAQNAYSQIMLIDEPTPQYNCHSYAWYSQDYDTNNYWINSPLDYFYDDESIYENVSTPQVGDIVLYVYSTNVSTEILHSAIVVSITLDESNNVLENITVQSKWGHWGLYEHGLDDCDYFWQSTGVAFFRRTDHTHSYALICDSSKQMHGKQCTDSDCGQIIWTFDHDYTASTSYYDLNHHKNTCLCGAYELVHHDEYTVKSHTTTLHTLQLTCCGTRTVTNWHTYEDYDSDSHTGDCSFCNYTLTSDQAHTDGNYMDNGDGTHTNECNYCDYAHTALHVYTYYALDDETHQKECHYCDVEMTVEEHTWTDEYDEDGWYYYCTGCQYKIYMDELTADMIAKLPVEIQTEIQSAPQNAQLNAQPNGNVYYVIRIDDENGILYLNGEYYLLHYPEIPDAETVPSIPAEDIVS